MSERCLYLVRHGETEGESSIRYHGRNDVPLSDHGRRQVSGLVPLLRHVPFAAVVHSPLARATESAQILIDALERPPARIEQAPDLAEVDFGEMEGMTESEIAASMPAWFAEWKSGRAKGYPGGETFAGFERRIVRAFDGVLARHPTGHVLLVAHKGVIKRGAGSLLRMSADAAAALNPDLGSLTVLSCGLEIRLKHWNLTNDSS